MPIMICHTTAPSLVTAEEIAKSLVFLAVQKDIAVQQISELTPEETKTVRFTEQPEKQSLATFCQFLLSNNAFLYVD